MVGVLRADIAVGHHHPVPRRNMQPVHRAFVAGQAGGSGAAGRSWSGAWVSCSPIYFPIVITGFFISHLRMVMLLRQGGGRKEGCAEYCRARSWFSWFEIPHHLAHIGPSSIQAAIPSIARFSLSETKPSGTRLLPPTQAHLISRFWI